LLVVAALACLGLAVGWFVWLTTPTPGVTRENFDRLERGMTTVQVEAILGKPDYHTFSDDDDAICEWYGEKCSVDALFVRTATKPYMLRWACLETEEGYSWIPREENLLDRLRRLLPW
jgi:hypothetical protein